MLPLAGISGCAAISEARRRGRSRHHRRLRRPAAVTVGVRRNVRHAADRGGRRRAHGPHPDQGDRRNAGPCAGGRGRDRGIAADRSGCRRAGRPVRRTGSSSPPTSSRCSRTPTALSISPLPAATVAHAALAAQHKLVHIIGTTGLEAADEREDRGGGESPRRS